MKENNLDNISKHILNQQDINKNKVQDEKLYVQLEQLEEILKDENYFYLAHGTGRNTESSEVIESIFSKGLRTKDNSLYYTTIGLDISDIKTLKNKLEHWEHLNSKNIILARVPIKYINIKADMADLDGERYGAFMDEIISESGDSVYYLKPQFIIGCYNVEEQTVKLNLNFEIELSENTKSIVEENYKKAIQKTENRLKRLESNFNLKNEKIKKSEDVKYDFYSEEFDYSFDDNIDWDMDVNELSEERIEKNASINEVSEAIKYEKRVKLSPIQKLIQNICKNPYFNKLYLVKRLRKKYQKLLPERKEILEHYSTSTGNNLKKELVGLKKNKEEMDSYINKNNNEVIINDKDNKFNER